MSTSTFNFDNYFKALPNFTAHSQHLGRIFLDATTGIVKEQAHAAETAIDYGMKAFRVPESGEPADFLSERMQQQREFMEAMGESAERIFSIASEASSKAFTVWLDTAGETTPSDQAAA